MHDFTLLNKFFMATRPRDGKSPNPATIRRRVKSLLQTATEEGQLKQNMRQLVSFTGMDNFLPPQYSKFQKVVKEGLIYFLSELPISRLAAKIADQLRLPHTASAGRRMTTLVKDMPTLQKLGQIICRSPGLDPDLKQVLTDLEDNLKTVTFRQLQPMIKRQLKSQNASVSVQLNGEILAEATVSAVIPARIESPDDSARYPGVLKIIKPAVRRHLPGELDIWDRLGDYLDMNKDQWDLDDFSFKGTIDQVRYLLENEIDLSSEQRNLDAVRDYYASSEDIVIPDRLDVSTPLMTAMARVDGNKITDVAHLTAKQRRQLAGALVDTCILRPVQELNRQSFFHGDPHAGNLAYSFNGKLPRIILYDWAMTGQLSRLERFAIMLLTAGLVTHSRKAIYYAADMIAGGQISSDKQMSRDIKRMIKQVLAARNERFNGIFSTVEHLFEQCTYHGIVFTADILMFEKALVTLKGVVADIDPTFNRDEYLIWAALATLIGDFLQLRFHKLIVEEIWDLYRHSIARLIEIQKFLFRFMWDLGQAYALAPRPAMVTQ